MQMQTRSHYRPHRQASPGSFLLLPVVLVAWLMAAWVAPVAHDLEHLASFAHGVEHAHADVEHHDDADPLPFDHDHGDCLDCALLAMGSLPSAPAPAVTPSVAPGPLASDSHPGVLQDRSLVSPRLRGPPLA
jgi:hypothetical protein